MKPGFGLRQRLANHMVRVLEPSEGPGNVVEFISKMFITTKTQSPQEEANKDPSPGSQGM